MMQIFLFGALRILVDGQPFRFSALPKTTALLAYLLLHRSAPTPRPQLAYILWPDVGEAEARGNLRRHLHDLRRALPAAPAQQPWLLVSNETIQWNPAADAWTDIAAFEEAAAQPHRLVDAVAYYGADLLPGLYEDWAIAHRERLRTRLIDCLLQLTHQRHAAHDDPAAIAYAEQLLQHEPLREDVVRHLMSLRRAVGDRTGALHEFQRFAQRLRDALDAQPMLETSALYDAIARQLVAPTDRPPLDLKGAEPGAQPAVSHHGPDAPPGNLPAQLTTFIGRAEEVAAVRGLLTSPAAAVRLLTLTGPGGCGKTRLALEVATRLRHDEPGRYPDGCFFVSLAAVQDAPQVAATIADALGLRESGAATLWTTLTEYLRSRRLLLLLDNFEQITHTAGLVVDLLRAAPGLQVVVTSRTLLRIYGEHEFVLGPLSAPDPDHLPAIDALARYDAVALFVTRSRAANPNFVLNQHNAAAVAAICRQLDGLPLALELAAARTKVLTPHSLLARLTNAFGARLAFLVDRNRTLAERHQTLRATLTWSYDLLGPAEQRFFRRLAVFAGSFSFDAVEAVCDIGGELDPLAGLETLVDNSLLARVEQPWPDGEPITAPANPAAAVPTPWAEMDVRFAMLSIIRDFALELLIQQGEDGAARRRHAGYVLAFAKTAEPLLKGAAQIDWLKRLEQEQENWRAAMQWLLDDPTAAQPMALEVAATLGHFWLTAGYWAEGRRWLERALAATPDAPPALRAKAFCALGAIVHMQGDFEEARPRFEQSLALYRTVGDAQGAADALYGLGRLANRRGRYDEAEALLRESLARSSQAGDLHRPPYALNILAAVHLMRGDPAQAHELYGRALAAARASQDRAAIAFVLTSLGELARQEGDDEQAEIVYNEAMIHADALGQKARRMMLMHNLAYIALHRGNVERAAALLRDCLRLGLELPDKENCAMCLVGLGCVATEAGQMARAVRLFSAGVKELRNLGVTPAPADQAEYDRYEARLRAALDSAMVNQLWDEGQELTPPQAIALALAI